MREFKLRNQLKSRLYKLYHQAPEKIRLLVEILRFKYFRLPTQLIPTNRVVNKTIIILGMHRSGTSMVSRILDSLGVNLGGEMIPFGNDNPRGHFENKWFVKMNDKILAMAGGTWELPPNAKKIIDLKKNNILMRDIERLIRSQEDSLWGWKDPRSVLTLDLFFPYIKNPYIIFCNRNPTAISNSLNKRNGYSLAKGLHLNNIYSERLSLIKRNYNIPALELQFEGFFNDEEKEINRIKSFLSIKNKLESELVEKQLKHF